MPGRFNDSEKFRANMMLLFGIALMSPVSLILSDFIVNEERPRIDEVYVLLPLFVIGFLLTVFAYSIMYIKDKNDG